MPTIFSLFLSIFIAAGFFFLGIYICNILKLSKILKFVSVPHFQYPIFGISFFLYILFPFFLFGIFNKTFFHTVAYCLMFIGFVGTLSNVVNIYNYFIKIKNKLLIISFEKYLVIILFALYFFISLSPPTSGDSLSYHLSVAKYIISNGIFPTEEMDFHGKLAGVGEFLNAFAISVNAEQFTSFVNFLGLVSIFGIIEKFSNNKRVGQKNNYFLLLLLLSCPSLIFLISSSKPHFFYLSLVFFSYSVLIILDKIIKNINYVTKTFFLINILLIVSINAKINFLLSFFIINTFFIYFIIKKLNKPKVFAGITLCYSFLLIFGLLPFLIWKSINYHYPFYNFIFNPLPINIPVYIDFFNFLKNYHSEKFPLILFIPLKAGDFTQILGIGCLMLLFLLKYNFEKKRIILIIIFSFIFSLFIFGQKTSRFYLEIYFLMILILAEFVKSIQAKKTFLLFKYLVYFQSLLVILSLMWGVINLFPGSLNYYLKDKVLSNSADGYSLIKWTNSVLPQDSVIIISHRSTFYFNSKYINPEPLGYMNYSSVYKDYYLNKIKDQNPQFILFYGSEPRFNYGQFNFKDCISKLFAEKPNVGFNAMRNPFNTEKKEYNGYIYYFDNSKMPSCVKSN